MIMTGLAGLSPPQIDPEDENAPAFAPNGDRVLSPSQVKTFMMCPRMWAAKYLHGQHPPPAEGTLAGKRMHKLMEVYYQKKIVPSNTTPEGVWALKLIAVGGLPVPGPGIVAERRFTFEHDGVWWRGSKDLIYDREGRRIVHDHKTTSRFGPWVQTDETLPHDPQAVIYAWEEYLAATSSTNIRVRCEWGYVTRVNHPQVRVPAADMPRAAVEAAMADITAVGKRMLQLYRERPELNDLPPVGASNGGCEAFSGCKVQGCNVSALDRIKGQQLFNAQKLIKQEKGDTKMGFMDDLKARQAQRAALAPPPAAAPPAPEAPAPAPAAAPAVAPSTVRELLTQVGAGAAINPPAFEPPAAAAGPVIPANSWVGGPSAPPPAATAPRRGRGRAKADAPVPSTTAPTTQQVIDTVGTAVGQSAAKSISTPPPVPTAPVASRLPTLRHAVTDGYVLCVNCAPMGAEIVMFSRYVGQVHEALKATKGCELYTLLGFEGTALYQDALAQLIDQAPPQGYLVVDTRTNEGRDAVSILERGATSVIRGF
jgi:hypothetical protein